MNFKLDSWKKSIPLAILIIILAFVLSSFLSSSRKAQPRVKAKTVKEYKKITVNNLPQNIEVKTTGRVNVYDKIDIYSEVTGVLERGEKEFRSGSEFSEGDVLLKINSDVTKMNLKASKGAFIKLLASVIPDIKIDFPSSADKWEKYLLEFDIDSEIKPLPKIEDPKEKLYLAGNNIFNQYYSIKSQEELFKKYTIFAPFSGVLSESNLKEGTLVRAGQKAGVFLNNGKFEIELSVFLKDLKFVKPGQQVMIYSEGFSEPILGKVKRINSVINESTQTVKVYVISDNHQLKEGMYVDVLIKTGTSKDGIKISRKLLKKGNQVFCVVDNKLELRSVELIKVDGENIVIAGLENGTQLLGVDIPNAYEGMIIN